MSNHSVCFYFQVHQPYRLRDLRISELDSENIEFFDEESNRKIFRKVAEKCYLPTNALLLKMIQENPEFKIAYSLSGVFIDQCIEYGPDVLDSFKQLAKTGNVEFLAETYYHSLSVLNSIEEFCAQVTKHTNAIRTHFKQTPKVFRNTELIYNNHIANIVREMGYSAIVTEGTDKHLAGRSPNNLYKPVLFEFDANTKKKIRANSYYKRAKKDIHILLKNYQLSDDIAFRFSNQAWLEYPLNADKFTQWIKGNSGHTFNLFMDYETFGEHQWAESGIFNFLAALPNTWKLNNIETKLPSEVIKSWHKDWNRDIYNIHECISWADSERDLSAWRGNLIQEAAFKNLYDLQTAIVQSENKNLLEIWRKLQTSDHFYYMCTKFWADGDVHKYFSPYDSPYEAYRRFSHAIAHLKSYISTHSHV